ncbi:TRAP transporter substrate-binding protein [Chloroflexota bacterium]
MKTILLITSMILVLSLLALGFGCAKPATTPTVTLTFSGFYPPGVMSEELETWFQSRVMELSNGQIKFVYYPAQQLNKGKEILNALKDNVADTGTIINAYFTGKHPMLGIGDLPFMFECSPEKRVKIAQKLYQTPQIKAVYEPFNTKILSVYTVDDRQFHSKVPISKLEDFKGLKVRGSGWAQTETIKALGAGSTVMSASEMYLGLSTGVIDAAMNHASAILTRKIQEVTKYTVVMPVTPSGGLMMIGMNTNSFNKLSPELQKVMVKAGEEHGAHMGKVIAKWTKEKLKELEATGQNIIYIPDDEFERWKQVTRPIWAEWVKQVGPEGQPLIDLVLEETGKK